MTDPITKLKDLISQGLVMDIFRAEQSLGLLEEMGHRTTAINEHNFGELFGTLH